MADAITMEFTAASQKQFANAIRMVQDELGTKSSSKRVVNFSAKQFMRSAVPKTPMARSNFVKWFEVNELPKATKQRLLRENVITASDEWVNARKAGLTFTRRGRGYARSGWVRGGKKFGKRVMNVGPGSFAASEVIDRRQRAIPYVEIANQVPFIDELDDGTNPRNVPYAAKSPAYILSKSQIAAAKSMMWYLERRARRARSKWGR